jgi:hypothetical protein
MRKFALTVVLVAIIGVATPAFAEVVDVGIPVGPTGSWGPTFYFNSSSGQFDQVVAIRYLGQSFETAGGVTASPWTSATDPSGNWTSMQGPLTFNSPWATFHLADPTALTQFYTLQYSNGTLLSAESALVSVGPGFEDHVQYNYGTWGWTPTTFTNPDRIGVPEPGMIATLMLGILGVGLFRRKRYSNPV